VVSGGGGHPKPQKIRERGGGSRGIIYGHFMGCYSIYTDESANLNQNSFFSI
jgi:hypothetical protein